MTAITCLSRNSTRRLFHNLMLRLCNLRIRSMSMENRIAQIEPFGYTLQHFVVEYCLDDTAEIRGAGVRASPQSRTDTRNKIFLFYY